MIRSLLTAGFAGTAFSLAAGTPATAADPRPLVVNCAAGETIAAALATLKQRRGVMQRVNGGLLRVKGNCQESVLVDFDDVTIEEDPTAGGKIIGSDPSKAALDIVRAQRVTVRNLSVSNGNQTGIKASYNATVKLENLEVQSNSGYGIIINRGANAEIINCTVTNNLRDGIVVSYGAFAYAQQNMISGNGRPAPYYEYGLSVSRAQVWGRGNTIVGHGDAAVQVGNGATYSTGVSVNPDEPDEPFGPEKISAGTAPMALAVKRMSFADLRAVEIDGKLFISDDSHVVVRSDRTAPNTSFSKIGDASLLRRSYLALESVDISGTVGFDPSDTGDSRIKCSGTFPNQPCVSKP